MAIPNWTGFINSCWAPGGSGGDCFPYPAFSSNIVLGSNPPYSPQDFLNFYPKFGGSPLVLTGTVTANSPVLEAPIMGLAVGNLVAGNSITDGSTILSLTAPTTITLSQPALANDTIFTVYNSPFVPSYVIGIFVNLASSRLVYNRWLQDWYFGMCLFIAHYCTLYLQSDVQNGGYNNAGQAATAGLARGIATSKAAGGVSIGYTPTLGGGAEDWSSFNLTSYGQQFITMAMPQGAGPVLLY